MQPVPIGLQVKTLFAIICEARGFRTSRIFLSLITYVCLATTHIKLLLIIMDSNCA